MTNESTAMSDEPGAVSGEPTMAGRVSRGRGFGRFVARRLAIGVLQVFGVTLVTFAVVAVVPGDPAAANLGQSALADPTIVAAFRHHYGLDRPLPVQYALYVWHLLHGDLGQSQLTQRPVLTDLRQYFPATAELALCAIVVALALGVALGLCAALYHNRPPDRLIRLGSLAGISIPNFWLGLAAFYLFFYKLGWLPGAGRLSPQLQPPRSITGLYTVDSLLTGNWNDLADAARHLVLPASVLACYTVSLIARFSRSAVLDVLGQDYVRAARAKGLPERVVIRRHILRPALLQIITVAGLAFGALLSGAVLVEQVFSWPGIGQYAYRSATALNLPGITGVCIVIAIIYILVNLGVDILYVFIDPRLSLR
jgi:peptide/nickel transport system permease protein